MKEGLGQFFLWGWVSEMDLVTFEKKRRATLLFVSCGLPSALFVFSLLKCFGFFF